MHENSKAIPRAVLAAVDTGDYNVDVSLSELAELARTAGIETVAELVQKRDTIDRATCIGAGKLGELSGFVLNSGADMVIFDHELNLSQLRNIEKICGAGVIDRTMLILEIFARHASTHEGRLQVELARNRYLMPRLAGLGNALSRLGGGGGGAGAGARRGKGETKLELDRRHIRRRIAALEEQLGELAKRRGQTWRRRKKDGVAAVAIVGYTNAGKSTLLNALTGAEVLAEDKLFATLDPTARALDLPDGRQVLLIDTVGFVRRLPHHLVEAFHSTLEEAVHAELILNVCDASSAHAPEQIEIARTLLSGLGVKDTPILNVLNKCDKLLYPPEPVGRHTAVISAASGLGIPDLLEKIAALLVQGSRRLKLLVPYDKCGIIAEIRNGGKVYSEEFVDGGVLVDALVEYRLLGKVRELAAPK